MSQKLSRCEGTRKSESGYGEIADTLALGASGRKAVGVQILLPALFYKGLNKGIFIFTFISGYASFLERNIKNREGL